MNLDWLKIIGNSGTAFFTSLMGLTVVAGGVLPEISIVEGAIFTASVAGGLAFFKGLQDASTGATSKGLSKLVLF